MNFCPLLVWNMQVLRPWIADALHLEPFFFFEEH